MGASRLGWWSWASAQAERRGRVAAREGKRRATLVGLAGLACKQARPGLEQGQMDAAGKKRSRPAEKNDHGRSKLTGRTEEGERRFIYFSLFLIFSKQFQNEISTQLETRLQTKQYKILCNSMNAHSLLLTLYLVLFLIKLLFPKFECPQNA